MKPIEPDSLPPIKPYSLPSDEVGESRVLRGWEVEDLVRGHWHVDRAQLLSFLSFIFFVASMVVGMLSMGDDRLEIPAMICSFGFFSSYGISVVMGIFGLLRVERGIRFHPIFRIILIPAIVIPWVNFFVLMFLNAEATGALRAAGYRVGFLGNLSKKSVKEMTADPDFTSPSLPPTGASR